MMVRVRLFAFFREATGASTVELELGSTSTVRDLLSELRRAYPRVGPSIEQAMIAVNLEYVGPDYGLCENDEVAIIPPVSGGSSG